VKTTTLLVVEDQWDLLRSLCRFFRAKGFNVHGVNTCTAALAWGGKADCAILDIDLPDGSGLDLARTLQAEGHVTNVVFFSAQSDLRVVEAAENLAPFVPKSGDFHELLAVLRRSVALNQAVQTAGSGSFEKSASAEELGAGDEAKAKIS
jgi:DNA-binding response OmpR family regulator